MALSVSTGGARAPALPRDQHRPRPAVLDHRQGVGAVMGEGRRALLPGPRAGQPRPAGRTAAAARGASPAACARNGRFPRPAVIQLTSPGRIGWTEPQAVPVQDLSLDHPGDGGEPDMRVRPHVDAGAGQELRRPHLVEEHERPDHPPLRRRQRPAHLEPADVAGARDDDRVDRIAGWRRREAGILVGQNGHRRLLRRRWRQYRRERPTGRPAGVCRPL